MKLVVQLRAVGVGLLGCGVAVAQSQPTPGLPSQPFTAVAQAQNGGAGPRVTYQYGMEFVTVPGGSQFYPGGSPNDTPGLSPGVGRGAVAEDFRIGRYEVGRASWNAFFNAAEQVRIATGQAIPWLSLPGVTVNHRFQNAPSGGGPSISSSSSIVQYR